MVEEGDESLKDGYLPIEITQDASILDKKGQRIITFDELENKLPKKDEHIFNFKNAYILVIGDE